MIRVVIGDLSLQETDAVLRPIRDDLTPTTAAGRDLGARAGEAMDERLSRMGTLPVGGAVITPGGVLGSAFVIHVVVSSPDEPETSAASVRALRNGLRRATEWDLGSLALPPLGLTVGTVEPEEAARSLVEVLAEHLDEGHPPLDLTIVVGNEYEEAIFARAIDTLARGGSPTPS